jgi:Transcription factor S-II (TFIIS), central domain/TFIIS helical bundle-like domain
MASTNNNTKQVERIKEDLSKKLSSIDSLSDGDVEGCKDMLERLDGIDVTLDVLTTTLIGTVVSKFKGHEQLGPKAKALVKKWKGIAKKEGVSSSASSSSSPKPPPASAASASASAAGKAKPPPPAQSKAERRESTNSETGNTQQEWASLPSHRQTTCQKLHDFLKLTKKSLVAQGINASAIDHLLVERATEVEMAIQKKFSQQKPDYLAKARSLCFNIKKNSGLASEIILGQMEADELVTLPADQLASAERKKEMEERTKKLMASKQLDWESQNEDKINKMCGITGDLLKASLFTWYVTL